MTRRDLLCGVSATVTQTPLTWAKTEAWECPVHGKILLPLEGSWHIPEVLKFSRPDGRWEDQYLCIYCVVEYLAKRLPKLKKMA